MITLEDLAKSIQTISTSLEHLTKMVEETRDTVKAHDVLFDQLETKMADRFAALKKDLQSQIDELALMTKAGFDNMEERVKKIENNINEIKIEIAYMSQKLDTRADRVTVEDHERRIGYLEKNSKFIPHV